MVDQGIDGVCILANYSEQFFLTDDERDTLVDLCLSHVAGRIPVIVTCSHFSTRIAAERARRAAAAGAAMLMLMPPYHGASLRADESSMIAHFARVAEAAQFVVERGAEVLITGCTELPLIFQSEHASVPIVDPTQVLAEAAVRRARTLIASVAD